MPRPVALTAVLAAAAALALPTAAPAHEGNPNFRSVVRSVTPQVPGVVVDVLNYDDSLEVRSTAKEIVVIEGYDEEPYARILPDGLVQVNENSTATYLNEERFGGGTVPKSATRGATPVWRDVDRSGTFAYHDHRIHYMGKGRPPAVTDPAVRTKAFDWKVPVRVGATAATISGELLWVPTPDGGPPAGAIVGFVVLLLAGGATIVVVRRRRRGAPAAGTGGEAW